MTDEKRLGLPEEPPRELYSNLMLLSDHHATWGAAWREKALELEKERDELRAQLKLAVGAVNRFITAKIDKGEMK
jgi:hypothetical protein